ncbi:MAG: alpha/beta hydrolase [Pseudomonadota bacterium]|nr:alpha/beta hydrolase [Pseudomonadota bacterium]
MDARREDGVRRRRFRGDVGGRQVPGVLFSPDEVEGPRPIILFGHGGSQHKEDPGVVEYARRWIEEYGLNVGAIDGPIHGERRADGQSGPAVQAEFRDVWATGNGRIDEMVEDWRATIDFLVGQDAINGDKIGWFGLSMGTAYGIPLIARDPRIGCALLGMWGLNFVNSARLGEDARKVTIPCAVQMKWDDQFFTRDGQCALFDRIGSTEKTLKAFLGGHVPPEGEQLEDLFGYLGHRLG